jgi:hypothetical protein
MFLQFFRTGHNYCRPGTSIGSQMEYHTLRVLAGASLLPMKVISHVTFDRNGDVVLVSLNITLFLRWLTSHPFLRGQICIYTYGSEFSSLLRWNYFIYIYRRIVNPVPPRFFPHFSDAKLVGHTLVRTRINCCCFASI